MKLIRIFIPVIFTIIIATVSPETYSQTKGLSSMTTEITQQYVSQWGPVAHQEIGHRSVVVDGESAELIRYERLDSRNSGLEGEHFSIVVSDDGTLKGFANISLDLVGKPLPTRERSEQIARAFLQATAPELLTNMELHFIEPHTETIKVVQNGRTREAELTGMKVKARNLSDGRYFWVIVGSDEKPMIFERDIVWVTFPGHRKTEKWLHDSWLKEKGVTFQSVSA